MKSVAAVSLVACLGLMGFPGLDCSGDCTVVRTQVISLSGPDSVGAGSGLLVDFGYTAASCGRLDSYSWDRIGATGFQLTVTVRTCRCSGVAPLMPPFPAVGSAYLESAPAGDFSITSGDLTLAVHGGPEPKEGGRLSIELRDPSGEPVVGAQAGYSVTSPDGSTWLGVFPPTDGSGTAVLHSACRAAGEYRIDPVDPDGPIVLAVGKWADTCARSQRLVTHAVAR